MKCIAIFDSANHVYKLDAALEKKGYKFEVVSIPCHLAKEGCGLCLKFPEEFSEIVMSEAVENNTPIKEVYRIVPKSSKNKYKRI